tara:strand:- start:1353 stop:2423 length:1071 start_codon:yes stop_codon:yes gene_type:complete
MISAAQMPFEIAGQLQLTSEGLRYVGVNSRTICVKHKFGYPSDIPVTESKYKLIKLLSSLSIYSKYLRKVDILHYHYGCSFSPLAIDVRLNKLLGKKIIVEFWGSDVRQPSVEKKRNPFYPGADVYGESDQISNRRMRRWAKLTDGVAVISDHSFNEQLLEHFKTVYIIGQRVDCSAMDKEVGRNNTQADSRLTIVHAPSNQAAKGTDSIEKAIAKLHKKYDFIYKRIEGLSHSEALGEYARADIVVDQLMLGCYGVLSCEAMAMGKPTICYLMEDLAEGYPFGLPIINANIHTVHDVLESLIQQPDQLVAIAKNSKQYATDVHSHEVVAKRLHYVYKKHLIHDHLPGIFDLRGMK